MPPNIRGVWRIVRPDKIVMDIKQDGDNITASFSTNSFDLTFDHTLKGHWNDTTQKFDYTLTRKVTDATDPGYECVGQLYGHLVRINDSKLEHYIFGSDGQCDVAKDFRESGAWERI